MSGQKFLDVLSVSVIHDQIARSDCLIMSSLTLFAQGILLKILEVPLKIRLLVLVKLSFVDAHTIWIFDVGYYLRNKDFIISIVLLLTIIRTFVLEV